MRAILDTNFLMIPGKYKVNIFDELKRLGATEFFTLDLCFKELMEISEKGGQTSKYAKLGLGLVRSKGVTVIETKGINADDEIVRIADQEGFAVATQDRALGKRLSAKLIEVFILRQESYLEKM